MNLVPRSGREAIGQVHQGRQGPRRGRRGRSAPPTRIAPRTARAEETQRRRPRASRTRRSSEPSSALGGPRPRRPRRLVPSSSLVSSSSSSARLGGDGARDLHRRSLVLLVAARRGRQAVARPRLEAAVEAGRVGPVERSSSATSALFEPSAQTTSTASRPVSRVLERVLDIVRDRSGSRCSSAPRRTPPRCGCRSPGPRRRRSAPAPSRRRPAPAAPRRPRRPRSSKPPPSTQTDVPGTRKRKPPRPAATRVPRMPGCPRSRACPLGAAIRCGGSGSPSDLEPLTTIGEEAPPAAGGVDQANVEAIWKAVVAWYRSRRPPGDADLRPPQRRGDPRPRDRPRPRQRARATTTTPSGCSATTETPVLRLLDVEGDHRVRRPQARRARAARRSTTRSPSYIPGYERNGKDGITIGHVLAHRSGVPNLPREALDLDRIDDREFLERRALRRASPSPSPAAPRLPRGLRRLHPRRGRLPGDRQGHPRRSWPRSSSTRSASAG